MCSGKALEDMNLDELDELEDEEEEKILLQMRFVILLNHTFTVFLILIHEGVLSEFGSRISFSHQR
jgi:hypothetical protein